MQNYQITEKEGNSDKECVLQASVEKCFMGGIENEHEKKESVTVRNCRPVRSGLRIAAAGLAGVLLAGNSTGAVSASQGRDALTPCVSGDENIVGEASAAGQRKIWWGKDRQDQDGQESDGQSSIRQSVLDWDEEEILERWELDPDDFIPGIDLEMMYKEMYWASEGCLWEKMQQGNMDVDQMEEDFSRLVDFWKSVYLRRKDDTK